MGTEAKVLTLDPDHKLGSVTVRDHPALPPVSTADGLGEHGGRDCNVELRLGRRELDIDVAGLGRRVGTHREHDRRVA